MTQVKVFKNLSSDDIEKEINEWLREMGDKIEYVDSLQTVNTSFNYSFMTTIFYKQKQ